MLIGLAGGQQYLSVLQGFQGGSDNGGLTRAGRTAQHHQTLRAGAVDRIQRRQQYAGLRMLREQRLGPETGAEPLLQTGRKRRNGVFCGQRRLTAA